MIKSFEGYTRMDTMSNGVAKPVWVEYPLAVQAAKWVCLLVLVGVLGTFAYSLAIPTLEYGVKGFLWSVTNPVNFIFLPITGVCVWVLKQQG